MADVNDVLSQAMIETKREIAAEAWDQEAVPLDNDGNRAMEGMGDGLEGRDEPEDDASEEDEQSETGEEGQEDVGEEGDESVEAKDDKEAAQAKADAAKDKTEAKPEPQGHVPSGRLRKQTERADKAEAALRTLQEEPERERADFNKKFDDLNGRLTTLVTGLVC